MCRPFPYSSLILCLAMLTGCVTRSDHAIEVDGDRRTYRLHVSSTYDGSEPLPLLVAIHPFSGTGRSMARTTGFDALADTEKFIVVYPDGELRRWRAVTESRADVDFLLALLDSLEASYAIDPTRVYIAGASNGSHMAYRMLCEAGSRFAAAATVMGAQTLRRFDEACSDSPPVPLLTIQGTADKVLPWRGRAWPKKTPLLSMEESLRIWLERNGCSGEGTIEQVADTAPKDGTTATRTVYAPVAGGAPVVLYRVEGGGHTWPGGEDNYPEFIVGKTSWDFSASRVIWDFFKQYSREQRIEP